MSIKKIILPLLGIAAVLLGGCTKDAKDANSLAAIQKKGKIVMFTNAEFPPYEYVGDAGKPEGLDVDIAEEIARDLGVTLQIDNADFDGFSIALRHKKADMAVSAISITEERKESLDFSIPYVITIQYILKTEEDGSISSLNDLAGKKIGVQLGTTGDLLLSEDLDDGVLTGTGAVIVQYKSLQEAVLALKKGDLGAIVSDEGPIRNLAAANSGLVCFKAAYTDGPLSEEPYGIAVAKGSTELLASINKTLTRLQESGFIEERRMYHAERSIGR